MTVNAGGGTIDTQGFSETFAGAIWGTVATATLTKTGSGLFRLNSPASPGNFPGIFNVAGGTLNLNGGGALGDLATVNLADAPGALLSITGGNETIGALSGGGPTGGNVSLSSVNLTTGGNGASTTFAGAISGNGGIIKAGSGNLTLSGAANSYSGVTSVNAGRLTLASSLTSTLSATVQSGAVLEIAPNSSHVLHTGALTLSGSAQLNLQDNKIITTTTAGSLAGSAYTGVSGMIQSGRAGGTWNGSGIVTSMSDATTGNLTSIGVARASDVRPATASSTAIWAGQTITGTDTLIMYTYGGDATLDGKINVDDYIRIDNGIAGHLSGWSNGDFNYDGKVNIDDYTQFIDANIGTQGAPFSTSSGGLTSAGALIAAVPEPGMMGLVIVGGFLRAARRRGRRPGPTTRRDC
jgi:autotransporter-associated beta strand protein